MTVAPTFPPYRRFEGEAGPDPRETTPAIVAQGLLKIVVVEGPVLAKRACDLYLRGCGVRRMGGAIGATMLRALDYAQRKDLFLAADESGSADPLRAILRLPETPPVVVRERGDRDIDEIPPAELKRVADELEQRTGYRPGDEALLRAVLDAYGLKRLTANTEQVLKAALGVGEEETTDALVGDTPNAEGSGAADPDAGDCAGA